LNDWLRCSPWIAAALEASGGTHHLSDVVEGIATGQFQFWPGERSACVTEIIDYPRKRALCFWLAGGDLIDLMRNVEPIARKWAEDRGCTLFYGNAVERPGWERALSKYGYAPGWRVFRRSECP
jgi:hypothetical protein